MMTKQRNCIVSILHWNNDAVTNECIESFLNISDSKRPDILVVDNGSNKHFVLRANLKYKVNATIITSEFNLGFGGGHNLGIRYAIEKKYKYIVLLNNDTLVKSTDIFDKLEETLNGSSALAVAPRIINSDGTIWFGGSRVSPLTSKTEHILDESVKEISEQEFLSGCCLMIGLTNTKEPDVLIDDSYFMYWEDNDWCYRQRKNGFKLLYNPKVYITHVVSGSLGVTSPVYVYYIIRNHIRFIRKNLYSYHKLFAFCGVVLEKLMYLVNITMHKNRKSRFKALFWGLIDGVTNKSGKLERTL
jgi:GT2 family glycosyltransferase